MIKFFILSIACFLYTFTLPIISSCERGCYLFNSATGSLFDNKDCIPSLSRVHGLSKVASEISAGKRITDIYAIVEFQVSSSSEDTTELSIIKNKLMLELEAYSIQQVRKTNDPEDSILKYAADYQRQKEIREILEMIECYNTLLETQGCIFNDRTVLPKFINFYSREHALTVMPGYGIDLSVRAAMSKFNLSDDEYESLIKAIFNRAFSKYYDLMYAYYIDDSRVYGEVSDLSKEEKIFSLLLHYECLRIIRIMGKFEIYDDVLLFIENL